MRASVIYRTPLVHFALKANSTRARQQPVQGGAPRALFDRLFRAMSSTGSKQGFMTDPSERWWDDTTTAIITGANKGIGKAAAQIVAQNGLNTVVAARDEKRGREAVEELKKVTGSDRITFEQLDISDASSVTKFAERVAASHSNVAVLINNAGMAFKGNAFGASEARQTIDTNFLGTQAVCEALVPLMAKRGRIVNVCSTAGEQRIISNKSLLQRFRDADSGADIEALANEYVSGIESGSYKAQGWPGSMYGVSKLCEATYTQVLAKRVGADLDVNGCCPGYVATDMSSHGGYKTPLQGADTPVWLALLAPQGTTGKFFKERREAPF